MIKSFNCRALDTILWVKFQPQHPASSRGDFATHIFYASIYALLQIRYRNILGNSLLFNWEFMWGRLHTLHRVREAHGNKKYNFPLNWTNFRASKSTTDAKMSETIRVGRQKKCYIEKNVSAILIQLSKHLFASNDAGCWGKLRESMMKHSSKTLNEALMWSCCDTWGNVFCYMR